MSRRRFIQILGLAGGGMGSLLLGRAVFNRSAPLLTQLEPSPRPPLSASDFTPVQFKTITVNGTGDVTSEDSKEARIFKENISGIDLELMLIPGGSFLMGSPDDELERFDSEGPQHEVTVASFLMGRYPVTQAQWKAVAALPQVERPLNADPSIFNGDNLNADPSSFNGDNRPVEQVSWYEAVEFCQRLSRHTSREYRLPSEAEWEYACRAGTTTPFHFGETITTDVANYRGTDYEESGWSGSYGDGPKGEYREQTTDVGSFPANAFGLYDMHGNVLEWCQDHYGSYEQTPTDGSAWITDDEAASRILRGGSWFNFPRNCRSAYRYTFTLAYTDFFVGFRVSCSAPRT